VKAVVRRDYGPPEVLGLEEVPTPVPAGDEVLVRVRASSVNMADVDYLRGRPWLARLGTGLRRPRTRIPGIDMAGEVEATAGGATRIKAGDRVFGDLFGVGSGAWAEYVSVPESALTMMPDSVTFEEAATVPSSGVFAVQGVRDRRPVKPGDEVLVNGASGNVGPFAVQVAKALGATVTGVCRTEKLDMVRSLGADKVIDYTQEDYRQSDRRYDLIVDIAARGGVLGLRRLLKPGGGYVVIGGTGFAYVEAATLGSLITVATNRKMGMLMWRVNDQHDMAYLAELLAGGSIRPRIDRTYELADVPDAIRYLESGAAMGKIVIRI
jgi:NADPH:quinone reductase-like Zn-dependent oxidoreductase